MRLLLIAPLLVGCVGPALFVDTVGDGKGVVYSDPAGIECGGRCAMVTSGRVTLAATPAIGSTFVGWDGACTGTDTCEVDMVDDVEVTARFELDSHLLTIIPSEGGSVYSRSGIDCGEDCNEVLEHGTRVELAPTPAPGYSFRGWTNLECAADVICVLDVVEPRELTATFLAHQTLAVSVQGGGSGSVMSSPAGIGAGVSHAVFPFGTVVVLHADVSVGSEFVGWSGDCAGTQRDCAIPMDRARTVTATFASFDVNGPCTQTLTVSDSGGAIAARLVTGTRLCLSPGVVISGGIVVPAGVTNVVIRGVSGGARPQLVSMAGAGLQVQAANMHIDNLKITAMGSGTAYGITTSGGSLTIRNSEIICQFSGCFAIEASSGGRVDVASSTLVASADAVLSALNASVVIADSELRAEGAVLRVERGSLSLSRSIIRSTGFSWGFAIHLSGGADLLMVDSTAYVGGCDVIIAGRYLMSNVAGGSATLNGNKFRKIAGVPQGTRIPFRSERADSVFHSTAANSFCNEGSSVDDGEFAEPWIYGSIASTSTFYNIAHAGPNNCP